MSDCGSDDRIRKPRKSDERRKDRDDDHRRVDEREGDDVDPRQRPLTPRQAYNMATDLGTGPNIRLKDNLIEGLAIVVCLILGAAIGVVFAPNRLMGAAIGGGSGMVAGVFGSGIFLMIYRIVKHSRGEHD